MELRLPTPLSIINKQCAENDGKWLVRIRIHPQDYDRLRKDLIEADFQVYKGSQMLIGGVPIIKDESCVEGPVCDWKEDTLVEDWHYIQKYLK